MEWHEDEYKAGKNIERKMENKKELTEGG